LIVSAKRPAPGLPFARQLHWVVTDAPASEATIGKLIEAASGSAARPGELWRHTRPYRGLEAMTEANSDFFFGRERETVEVVNALASERGKLALLLGNSGVGKSSLAQAGVLAALLRQQWPDQAKDVGLWPMAFDHSRHWCFLSLRPGNNPLKALSDEFLERWQFKAGAERIKQQKELVGLLREGNATLSDLLDETQKRYRELGQTSPPAFFLYIDQGEELYVRTEKEQRRRFSQIIANGLADPRLRALMSLRADFFGELQKDDSLYAVHQLISVPPLRENALRGIVSKPANLLSARFQTETLAADIARRAAEESAEEAGALPLLSYLLDDMWSDMVERGDGVLRLPVQSIDLGRVLVERANRFVAEHPASEDALRRVLTLKLATVHSGTEPTRRRAFRTEFTDEEWRLVSELADHPNRLLVTVTPEGAETYAEVAHETIFQRWEALRVWINKEKDFLIWKSTLEADRRAWENAPAAAKPDALLMGFKLAQAQGKLAEGAEDLLPADRQFIAQSVERDNGARTRARWVQVAVYVLLAGIIASLVGIIFKEDIGELVFEYTTLRTYKAANFAGRGLRAEAELALKRGETFQECFKDCPEMVVVPAGVFRMGSLV
jgi:energy-coupling factor transporter ATP-binding protein EcfA2